MGHLILVTGGVRSGKSAHAFDLARTAAGRVLFIATALPSDDEMRERIENHRRLRPGDWRTEEATEGELGEYVGGDEGVLLLDCLGLYVSRRLVEGETPVRLLAYVSEAGTRMRDCFDLSIIVTNEVGSGLVPDNRLARLFVETLGHVNSLVASMADEVLLMVSGLPVKVK